MEQSSIISDSGYVRNTIACMRAEEYLRTIPDGEIDLTVTSPPYADIRDYDCGFIADFASIIEQLHRVTKVGGIVIWVTADKTVRGSETGDSFRQALKFMDTGFSLYDTMIYAKNNPIPLTHRRYEQTFEYMFVFCKGARPKTFNPIMIDKKTDSHPGRFRQTSAGVLESAHSANSNRKKKIKGNIWYYSVGKGKSSKDDRAFEHPATFPEQLVEDNIASWSDEGDLVLDPFLGSGTTAVVSVRNKRDFCGCDVSDLYINKIAAPRVLDEILSQKRA